MRRILALALAAGLALAGLMALRELRGGTGYAAKVLCSGVFVAGRAPESLLAEDLGWFSWLHSRVDRGKRTASSDWHGLGRSTAVYRDGLGCALAVGASVDELRAQGFDPGPARDLSGIPWPVGDLVSPNGLDGARRAALDGAVGSAFGETDPQSRRRTRAVIVLHSGRLVAERYAPGFDATTPLLGWSMTKSVIATLIGVQVLRGRLDPAAGAPVASWQGDERAAITLEQLLRMTSGLAFSERNGALGDSVAMLFRSRSAAGYAAHSPLAHAPGTFWSYSSGTSNLLSGILRASLPEQPPPITASRAMRSSIASACAAPCSRRTPPATSSAPPSAMRPRATGHASACCMHRMVSGRASACFPPAGWHSCAALPHNPPPEATARTGG